MGAEYVDGNTMIPQNSTVLVHRLAGHPTDAINTSYCLLPRLHYHLKLCLLLLLSRSGIWESENLSPVTSIKVMQGVDHCKEFTLKLGVSCIFIQKINIKLRIGFSQR